MFSQLAGKASFVNYLPRLTHATADDGEPTPGYLLDERWLICFQIGFKPPHHSNAMQDSCALIGKSSLFPYNEPEITFQSVVSSHQLVDYLVHRLNKSSTPVKIKVLKIIVYVINNGHHSFRQQLRQNDGSIKNALLHSGPADPLLGITLYKDVQTLAQETLDLLFDPETMKEEESDAEVMASIESPSVFMGGMGAVASSGGKYDGFGNTMKEREGTVTDKMLDYLGRLMNPSDEQTNEVIRAALHSSPGDYQPVAVDGALIDPVYPAEIPTPKVPFIKNHVPGRAGGGWESDDDDHHDLEATNQMLPHLTAENSVADKLSDIPSSLQQQSESSPKVDILLEAQEMLTKYSTSPGLPSIDELDEVCAKCAVVGCFEIMQALPKVIPTFTSSSHKDGLMRILLLWEWLYHFDCLTQQSLPRETAEILDMIMNDLDLPAPCRSKAKKLKILHQKCQTSVCDNSISQVASS